MKKYLEKFNFVKKIIKDPNIPFLLEKVNFSKSELLCVVNHFNGDEEKYNSLIQDYYLKQKVNPIETFQLKKNSPLIEVCNVSKSFQNNKKNILNNISFNLLKKDFIAIIGPNGAGKTTLIETIIGFNKPTSGEIKYNYPYASSPSECMGVSFQKNIFLPSYTVWDYILFTIKMYKIDISLGNVLVHLRIFGLIDKIKSHAVNLSGGQQQRLNVVLSLMIKPKIIFLDELTNNLDIKIKKDILTFVSTYIKENDATGIIVSHNADEIKILSNKIISLKDGSLNQVYNLDKKISINKIHSILERNI